MRTRCFASLSIALVSVLLATSIALNAQNNQTGNIHGAVTDESAALIPGVTVTLTSPALIVPQTALTDEAGRGQHAARRATHAATRAGAPTVRSCISSHPTKN